MANNKKGKVEFEVEIWKKKHENNLSGKFKNHYGVKQRNQTQRQNKRNDIMTWERYDDKTTYKYKLWVKNEDFS